MAKGLAMKSTAPSRIASTAVRIEASAVTTITAASIPSARSRRIASKPEKSGSSISIRIASGGQWRAIASAAAPHSAMRISTPMSRSSARASSAWVGVSSTTSTRAGAAMGG